GHEEQESLNRAALEAVGETLRRLGIRHGGLGGFASWAEVPGLGRVALHVDGVGTKTLVLERTGSLWVAGWDCVAMNVNDLAAAGWRPVLLVDYVAAPRPDPAAFRSIMEGLRRASLEARAGLLGGETAILPGLARGFDVVCTALGVEAPRPRGYGAARPGDVLVGVASSGLHANGYSLARRIVEEKLGGYDATVEGLHIGRELSKPTLIYSNLVLEALEEGLARAAAHLTGGGWAKALRMLAPGLEARLHAPRPPRVFELLRRLGGVEVEEMYRTFNMGVGMLMAAPREAAPRLLELASSRGFEAWVLGEVAPAPGDARRVVVETPYGVEVVFEASG
ncbi:MAG: phosphoribosylformylglycinamidine cyclo-ligase, partial [Crenarchaeota archaeon]|nr:phosphoribosylformylglycinamidine cyclo-ligase [Thermoproteota archaeon]